MYATGDGELYSILTQYSDIYFFGSVKMEAAVGS